MNRSRFAMMASLALMATMGTGLSVARPRPSSGLSERRTIRDSDYAGAALEPRPAPAAPASPADQLRIDAAQRKRERKAAKLRGRE